MPRKVTERYLEQADGMYYGCIRVDGTLKSVTGPFFFKFQAEKSIGLWPRND